MENEDYVVHLVDDEEPVRKSMAFLLTTMGFTVRVYSCATEFLAVLPAIGRACLVTDVRMPGMSGIELLHLIGQSGRRIPTIVITGHGDVQMAVAAMKAGAVDFIEKPFADAVLVDAIRKAADSLEHRTPFIDDAAIHHRISRLSERERQVLQLVVSGLPNKTIGYQLSISARTVEVHRANVMSKMQARSLSELVRMVVSAGVELS